MQTTHTTYKCTFCIKQKSAQHLILIEYDTNTNQYKLFFLKKVPWSKPEEMWLWLSMGHYFLFIQRWDQSFTGYFQVECKIEP